MPPSDPVAKFIERWSKAEAAERANYQLFLCELCDILDVPRPDPAGHDTEQNAFVFERAVPLHQRDGKTTTGRIDLYKRACFVCECKQYAAAVAGVADPGRPGSASPATTILSLARDSAPTRKSKIARGSEAWDDAMIKARGQAENYARNLPVTEPTPPFILVVDVGHVFELYADFSQQGKAYLPFPDARANRIRHHNVVLGCVQRLARSEEFTREIGPQKTGASAVGSVKEQNRLARLGAYRDVMHPQLRQHFARVKAKITDGPIAFYGGRVIGGANECGRKQRGES